MKIYVGIIEDEEFYSSQLCNLLKEWSEAQNCPIETDVYSSGEEFLLQSTWNYNILFIDIQLKNMNGIKTAQRLRDNNYTGQIVFLTAFREYAFNGYDVQALNYLLKPITMQQLHKCLQFVIHSIQDEHYILRRRDSVDVIPYRQIMYLLSQNHQMLFVTPDKTYQQFINIREIKKHLPPQFIQCHRTTIINIEHVEKLKGTLVTMSDKQTLPVSNTYLQNVQKKLTSLVF